MTFSHTLKISILASADNEVGQIFNIGFMFPVCRKRDHDELDDYCDIPKKIVILESDLGEYPEWVSDERDSEEKCCFREVYHLPMCKCFDEPAESMEEDEVVLGFNDIDTPWTAPFKKDPNSFIKQFISKYVIESIQLFYYLTVSPHFSGIFQKVENAKIHLNPFLNFEYFQNSFFQWY